MSEDKNKEGCYGIRLTHIPTGIVVECSIYRTTEENRAAAVKVLRAKLHDREVR